MIASQRHVLLMIVAVACGRGKTEPNADEVPAIELREQPVIENGSRFAFAFDLSGHDPSTHAALLDRAVRTVRLRFQQARVAGRVSLDPRHLLIDLPPSEPETYELARSLVRRTGRLELHFADAGAPFMRGLAAKVDDDPEAARLRITSQRDTWTTEERKSVTDWYLRAADREAIVTGDEAAALGCPKVPSAAGVTCRITGRAAIDAYVARLAARDRRFAIPADRMLAYEHITPEDSMPYWRSYFIQREVELTGEAIKRAQIAPASEPEGRAVHVALDRVGTRTLAAASARYVGLKLAIVIDHEVWTAPLIADPIRDGLLRIRIRGTDPRKQEADARELAIVLSSGALPGPARYEYAARLVDGVAMSDEP